LPVPRCFPIIIQDPYCFSNVIQLRIIYVTVDKPKGKLEQDVKLSAEMGSVERHIKALVHHIQNKVISELEVPRRA
jgi:hypothetical protein